MPKTNYNLTRRGFNIALAGGMFYLMTPKSARAAISSPLEDNSAYAVQNSRE